MRQTANNLNNQRQNDMTRENMKCLIIRQPYASLVAYGHKKWEFRSYNTRFRGRIGIASSRGKPLKTSNEELNIHAKSFPRGTILATAELESSFPATNSDLKAAFKGDRKSVV